MPHIAFFSYASENLDRYMKDFFNDLCADIAPLTEFAADSERISFQDKTNLRVLDYWQTHIEGSLQNSSVLVCMTSVAYFKKEFCGKEYYAFDQKRRQNLDPGKDPPPLILPVIWAPVQGGLPEYMNEVQQTPKNIPDEYRKDGLRSLMRFNRPAYERCVDAFAKAIVDAAERYKKLKPLTTGMDFKEIPNSFAEGDWQEAANSRGWLPGPQVANFVIAAGNSDDIPQPPGRYGGKASEWRPYLPPVPATILDYARNATKGQSFKFREIIIGTEKRLSEEVAEAKARKNLTVLLADPTAAALDIFQAARVFEQHWWEGCAMILPCDDHAAKWEDQQKALQTAFPVLTQAQKVNYYGPIRTSEELQTTLDQTLLALRAAVTQAETAKKEKTGAPPPQVSGTPAGGPV